MPRYNLPVDDRALARKLAAIELDAAQRWRTRAGDVPDNVPAAEDVELPEWDDVTPEPPPPPPPEPFEPVILTMLSATTEESTPFTLGPVVVDALPQIPDLGGDPLSTPGFVWELSSDAGGTWSPQLAQTTRTFTVGTPPAVGTLVRFRCWNGVGEAQVTQTEVTAIPPRAPVFTVPLPPTFAKPNPANNLVFPNVEVDSWPAIPWTESISTDPAVRPRAIGFYWSVKETTAVDFGVWPNRNTRNFNGVQPGVGARVRFVCWNGVGPEVITETTLTAYVP